MSQAEFLSTDFPEEALGTLPKGGKRLTYVPVAEVLARMNDVLGVGNWSYHIERQWTEEFLRKVPIRKNGQPTGEFNEKPERWCMYHVRVSAAIDGVITERDGVGGYDLQANGMDIADAHKSGMSEALKKATQSLGVGLSLSRDEDAILAASQLMEEPSEPANAEDVSAMVAELKNVSEDIQEAVKETARSLHGFSWKDMSAEHYTTLNERLSQLLAHKQMSLEGEHLYDGSQAES